LSYIVSADAPPLSAGETQLVCLAAALLARCKLLVMDEPTSSTDAATAAAVSRLLRLRFSNRNVTCLTISHRVTGVVDACDRVIVMADGRVKAFAAPAEALAVADALAH
jgi:ABC-type multidrug transport system fused ATPase/permease subunit